MKYEVKNRYVDTHMSGAVGRGQLKVTVPTFTWRDLRDIMNSLSQNKLLSLPFS
jgi:hypothetical protein